ncbi:S1 family peptidase [Streptomyces oryzae]|uniref:S1 family peptidase n=1 Tax=Streptomyces oryzae TaxID=1434886 RepID=A0ABS3XJZ6_9ACTN|nr:S1 family peptidase [Streptomyces oryzae]MBO8195734.1 S1 family peptidase [Streptomyces oryzae]
MARPTSSGPRSFPAGPLVARRPGAAAAVAALAVAGLALPALSAPAPAAAAPHSAPTPAEPDSVLLRGVSRDLGLSTAEARTRLGNESAAAATATTLRTALGDSFAGARVSGRTAEQLTVATTDAARKDRITRAGATARVVTRSLGELRGVQRALDRAAARSAPVGVPVWYADIARNDIVVEARSDSAAYALLQRAGVGRDAVTVRHTTAEPRPFADLRGGDVYYMDGSGRCSLGFSVTKGGRRVQGGFLTAGHCGTPGTTTSGYDRQAQGTFRGSAFPGSDHAWVATNAHWRPRPLVNGYGNGEVPVTGSTEALEGSSVCRSGSTSGWHCGTIQQRDATVTYPQGTVHGMARTTVCSEPGDSGGPFLSGSQAQGMTSGGTGDCTSGGTTFFSPVNPALRAYGLTLVTDRNRGPSRWGGA